MSALIFEIIILIVVLVYYVYKFSVRNFDYWEKKGVPYVNPTPLVGNFLDVFTQRVTIGHHLSKLYNQFKSPYFGMFVLNTPHLVIRDPELIKAVLIKDFNNFYDRTTLSEEKYDPVGSKMLFLLKNPTWRNVRTKMAPVFTSGKIKNMLKLIEGVAIEMVNYLEQNQHKTSLEMKEVTAKYSTDVIASCAFGILGHSFESEAAEFRVLSRKLFDYTWKQALVQMSYFVAPAIVHIFRLPFFDPEATAHMKKVFWKTILDREISNNKRNDLIDILIELRNDNKDSLDLSGDTIVAQASQFFAAGFETVSATISFTLYELCLQPDIQTKLRQEILETVDKHGGHTYNAIKEMKYLDMVVSETLRKYPVLPFLDRKCAQDYKLPNSDLIIEKGTPVYIPLFALHYDPKYFPNPDVYDPNRFDETNKDQIPSFTYLPFGDGPRICIGARFGLVTTKMALTQILANFVIEKSADTPDPLVYETKTVLLASTVGLPVKIRKLATVLK